MTKLYLLHQMEAALYGISLISLELCVFSNKLYLNKFFITLMKVNY